MPNVPQDLPNLSPCDPSKDKEETLYTSEGRDAQPQPFLLQTQLRSPREMQPHEGSAGS